MGSPLVGQKGVGLRALHYTLFVGERKDERARKRKRERKRARARARERERESEGRNLAIGPLPDALPFPVVQPNPHLLSSAAQPRTLHPEWPIDVKFGSLN